MRRFAPLILLLLAPPALAQYWSHYDNVRFGYAIDIPPGFEGSGESDNGDGQNFYNVPAEQGLTVWGGNLLETFEEEAAQRQNLAGAENWSVDYSAATPQWAVFSGQRDHRVFYQRMMLLCDAQSYAAYRVEYNVRDLGNMDAVIDGLNRSLAANDC